MKKLIFIFCITALVACKSQQGTVTVDGFSYDGKTVCGNGTVTVIAPTVQQIDSALQALTKQMVTFEHISDSANYHTYKYKVCSPVLNQTK